MGAIFKFAPDVAASSYGRDAIFFITMKYLLRGYFLGVLTHTTAWVPLWGGEQTQVLV